MNATNEKNTSTSELFACILAELYHSTVIECPVSINLKIKLQILDWPFNSISNKNWNH